MMSFFTSIVTSCKDLKGKLRMVNAEAGGVSVQNRQLMQQSGFSSVPKAGDRITFLRLGNVVLGIASDCDDRPELLEGERAIHASKSCYMIVHPDGSIEIKAPKGVEITGDLVVKGDVSDSVGALSALRTKYNAHMHVGNLGAPTSPPTPAGQDIGGAGA